MGHARRIRKVTIRSVLARNLITHPASPPRTYRIFNARNPSEVASRTGERFRKAIVSAMSSAFQVCSPSGLDLL
jgi:hypothetical protein